MRLIKKEMFGRANRRFFFGPLLLGVCVVRRNQVRQYANQPRGIYARDGVSPDAVLTILRMLDSFDAYPSLASSIKHPSRASEELASAIDR